MTPAQFVQWLKGFAQAVEADPARMPTLPQWASILGQLTKVSEANTLDALMRECDKRDEAQAEPIRPLYPNINPFQVGDPVQYPQPYPWPVTVTCSDLPKRG
jgi:hypothetical protein